MSDVEQPAEQRIEEIRERARTATAGPWRWFGNTESRTVHLATVDRGRIYVLSPSVEQEQTVFHHDHSESYTLAQARDAIETWCGQHQADADGECRCAELREFLSGDLYPEEGYRDLDRDGRAWLSRASIARTDLRFQADGLMDSYRDHVRYEVLGFRSAREFQAEGGNLREALYREDFCGIDHPDAEFIAHARDDIDFLLDRIAELEAELADCAETVAG